MVLWEITLATAYWLGIRKTYKIALKLQRRLISPRYPRIRDFLHRRTRNVFDVALKVHKGIQERDLSAGKSVGNFILRFLDRARPTANIRTNGQKRLAAGNCPGDKGSHSQVVKSSKSEVGLHDKLLFTQYAQSAAFGRALSNRISVGIGRMSGIQSMKSVPGARPSSSVVLAYETFSGSRLGSSFEKGVFREDIAQWMVRKPV